jgi:1-acyl-sn-glycerol-3-phosphate acyltransferase
MRTVLPGIYTYAEFGAFAFAFLPLVAIARAATASDETRRIPGRWVRRFGRVTSSLTPLWKFSVLGNPPADIATRAYVVVANHESTADPFLLSWLPWDMRWVVKEELFRIPIAGWMVRLGGDVPLRRGSGESVREMLAECEKTLRGGLSVMIFPEGTRSRDGKLQVFKDGAFQLAIDTGSPILPIAVEGTRNCRPKESMWFGRARATATILEPIATIGMTREDVPRLRELARTRIAASLGVETAVADTSTK